MIDSVFFIFNRLVEIVFLIPIIGMLAYFVDGYIKANMLTPSYILILFIVSTIAIFWAADTLIRLSTTKRSAIFVACIDLCFFGAFVAAVYQLRFIANADCASWSGGSVWISLGPFGSYGQRTNNPLSLNVNKTCAMLKASFAIGIMEAVFFFWTAFIAMWLHRTHREVVVKETTVRRRSHSSRRHGSGSTNMAVTKHLRDPPPLYELAAVIEKALLSNFKTASAAVVECPDLTQPPFNLAASGLSGNPRIADIGGQGHLFPRPILEAKYSLLHLAQDMEMSPNAGFVLGAGAAPFQDIGLNAELAPNLSWQANDQTGSFDNPSSMSIHNDSRVIKVNESRESVCEHARTTNCALMVNLYGSDGDTGPVLKIKAKTRTGVMNFPDCIRSGLRDVYGDSRPLSLGGVFLLESGKAKFHIMPDFPAEDQLPFRDRTQLEREWLSYHVFEAPVVCLTVMHSADPERLGLRMEHTHCFEAGDRKGGHYHYDVPGDDEVGYEAYFNVASVVYRIDQPV
ncbi:unnamed protein product [Penicillium salamii]|nr:unnamed protein product [Penicillium salamii]CAG8402938.1 unnamed protein product [Penicillium salamii]